VFVIAVGYSEILVNMMKMMIDSSCGMIYNLRYEYRKTDLKFLQLRTPLTGYKKDGLGFIQYGLDNGSFTDFNPKKFEQMAHKAKTDNQCLWIALPDVVGDHESTMILYHHWLERLDLDGETKKRCFVLQDGCNLEKHQNEPPWDILEAVFVGGTDYYKSSRRCYEVVEKAQKLGKWVHVGRVNTPKRICYWYDIADSFDGSGIARFTHMRDKALQTLISLNDTQQLRLNEC